MPYCVASFSAVSAIGSLQYVSSSADHSVSSAFSSTPSRVPQRTSRSAYGAWLMLSVPPASATDAWPSRISCAALTTAWKPEPQSRLTVSAGVAIGTPARSATWRARYAASRDVCTTLPKTTQSTCSARALFGAASTALLASTPRSVAVACFSLPPNVPKGVRFAATIHTVRAAMLAKRRRASGTDLGSGRSPTVHTAGLRARPRSRRLTHALTGACTRAAGSRADGRTNGRAGGRAERGTGARGGAQRTATRSRVRTSRSAAHRRHSAVRRSTLLAAAVFTPTAPPWPP